MKLPPRFVPVPWLPQPVLANGTVRWSVGLFPPAPKFLDARPEKPAHPKSRLQNKMGSRCGAPASPNNCAPRPPCLLPTTAEFRYRECFRIRAVTSAVGAPGCELFAVQKEPIQV